MRQTLFITLLFISCFYSCSDDDNALDPIPITDPETAPFITNRVICENGFADIYPCDGYDFMSRIDLATLNNSQGANDIWGWTDPTTGEEYALLGVREGTFFINVSNPEEPRIIGNLPTATVASAWRDIKVYQNYAFIVSEAEGHGMQVFDLTRLRNVPPDESPVFDADALYTEFGNAHNIVINETSSFAYAVGTTTFSGGPHIIDIQNPLNPTFAGGFGNADYTHDAQVVTYNGPDTDYTGREIYIGSNENEVVILDVTDKANVSQISAISYTNVGFTHQGWLTEDHQYFIANDELDESNLGFNTRTLLFDFTDLDNPFFFSTFTGPTLAIDHNLYIRDNELFLSNYTAGIRVANLSGIATGELFDTGSFDTFPSNNSTSFNGVWSLYPYFSSNNIIISDIQGGLFIIRKTGT